jgi:hypothetical protein
MLTSPSLVPLVGLGASYTDFPCTRKGRYDCNCAGFRMTAHDGRCHEHWGRRPKASKERNRDQGTCADAAGAELFLPRTATQLRDVGTSIAHGGILVLFRP